MSKSFYPSFKEASSRARELGLEAGVIVKVGRASDGWYVEFNENDLCDEDDDKEKFDELGAAWAEDIRAIAEADSIIADNTYHLGSIRRQDAPKVESERIEQPDEDRVDTEENLILEDAHSFSEDMQRSEDEGWFYPDDNAWYDET